MTEHSKNKTYLAIPTVISIIALIISAMSNYGTTQARLSVVESTVVSVQSRLDKVEEIQKEVSGMAADIRELTTKINIIFNERQAK
jgi:peptidoglycan hydrolase CwlO-like protein